MSLIVIRVGKTGCPEKMSESQTKSGNQRKFENLKKIENLKFF